MADPESSENGHGAEVEQSAGAHSYDRIVLNFSKQIQIQQFEHVGCANLAVQVRSTNIFQI